MIDGTKQHRWRRSRLFRVDDTVLGFAKAMLANFVNQLTTNDRDAAKITIKLHALGQPIDEHIAGVLYRFAQKLQPRQDRYGK